jgi:hypothetical protein
MPKYLGSKQLGYNTSVENNRARLLLYVHIGWKRLSLEKIVGCVNICSLLFLLFLVKYQMHQLFDFGTIKSSS